MDEGTVALYFVDVVFLANLSQFTELYGSFVDLF